MITKGNNKSNNDKITILVINIFIKTNLHCCILMKDQKYFGNIHQTRTIQNSCQINNILT